MSAGNVFENELMQLIFNNVDIPDIGDAGGLRGSVTPGNLYVALHTASPGEAGNQGTNEISYTGYGRVAVARSPVGWSVVNEVASNAAPISFGECTGAGGVTATAFSIGVGAAGATKMLHYGDLTTARIINVGITPQFDTGQLTTDVD